MGSEHHSGGFLNLSIFLKIFQFDLLFHVATLGLNVTTLIEFRKIKPLSRHDVGSAIPILTTFWNVVTLDLNVAMLDLNAATLDL